MDLSFLKICDGLGCLIHIAQSRAGVLITQGRMFDTAMELIAHKKLLCVPIKKSLINFLETRTTTTSI